MQSYQKSKSNPQKTGKWCAMHVRIAWEIYNHQQKNGQATSQLSNAPSVASKGFIQGPPPSQGRSSSSSDHTPKQEVPSKNRPSSSTGSMGPSPSSTPTTRDLPGVFPNLMPPSAHGNSRLLPAQTYSDSADVSPLHWKPPGSFRCDGFLASPTHASFSYPQVCRDIRRGRQTRALPLYPVEILPTRLTHTWAI